MGNEKDERKIKKVEVLRGINNRLNFKEIECIEMSGKSEILPAFPPIPGVFFSAFGFQVVF